MSTSPKHLLSALALLLLLASAHAVFACEGSEIARLAGVAVSRCLDRDVTLSFDCKGKRDRVFVTINDQDARRIYETLKPYYEAKP